MRKYCWLSIALVLAIFLAVPWSLSAADEVKTLEIGEKAPNFRLPGVDGKKYSLKDFAKADILVIVFTCNHCPTAQAYEDRIKKLAEDYRDKGVALVAISPNDPKAVRLDELGYTDLSDSFGEMKIRAREHGFNFPYLYDGDTQKVSRAFGPLATPHVFIFDKKRTLRYVGRVDDSEKAGKVNSQDTRNAIEAILAGKPVSVEKTKLFGCSIKWADKEASVKAAFERWAKEEVTLESIDEQGIKELVKNPSDKLLLLNIWGTWCGPCVAEFPELMEINRMYRNREFEMVTLSTDLPSKKDKALNFLKKQQASTRNYIYNSEELNDKLIEAVDKQWRGIIVPYTMLIEPGGKIIFRKNEMMDPLEVKKVIVEYLGRYYK